MPEIIKMILPTNIWIFLVWIIAIVLVIFKSKKIQTKWFSWELQKTKPSPGPEGELILKDRLLKEYKIFRSNILSGIDKLRICFRSNFRECIICYIDEHFQNEEYNVNMKQCIIKTYETLLELSLRTIVVPMIINMIFRNGFPSLPQNDELEYDSNLDNFTKVCLEKYNTILISLELSMDTDWFDFSIDPVEFKKFYHKIDTKTIETTKKETISFFKKILIERDFIIKLIYKDFPKLFKNEKECIKFCQTYMRELYE